MKYLLITAISSFVSILAFTQSSSQKFDSPDKSFAVEIPASWVQKKSQSSVLLAEDAAKPGLSWEIEVFKFSFDPPTLEQFSKTQLDNFKGNRKGADKLNSGNFQTIANRKWWVIDYTSSKGTRYISYQTIEGNTRYSIYHIATTDASAPALQETAAMVASFSTKAQPIARTEALTVAPAAQQPGKPAAPAPTKTITPATTEKSFSGPAGTVAADAVKMDVDEMDFFYGRYTPVKKGDVEALMDETGKIIIPFGKYIYPFSDYVLQRLPQVAQDRLQTRTISDPYYGTLGKYNANAKQVKIFGMTDKFGKNGSLQQYHYITTDGKIITGNPDWFDHEGWTSINLATAQINYAADGKLVHTRYDGKAVSNTFLLKARGDRFAGPQHSYTWKDGGNGNHTYSNGLLPAVAVDYFERTYTTNDQRRDRENNKMGFINRKGEFQVKPRYAKVAEFSEGIAFVCRLNAFDVEEWGAIDTLGNLVIPYKFRTQPGRFSNGRSLVQAIDLPTVSYFMINKKGEVVFSIPKRSGDTVEVYPSELNPVPEKFLYSHGYTVVSVNLKKPTDNIHLLDTMGNYIPILKMIRAKLPEGMTKMLTPVTRNQFLFSFYRDRKTGVGMADINGNIIIPPVFTKMALFEPESALQYAESGANTAADPRIQGYIDRTGVYRIIKSNIKPGF